MKKSDGIRLRHILDAIGNIEAFTAGMTEEEFAKDEKTVSARGVPEELLKHARLDAVGTEGGAGPLARAGALRAAYPPERTARLTAFGQVRYGRGEAAPPSLRPAFFKKSPPSGAEAGAEAEKPQQRAP